MRALVTGGDGFIGQHLIPILVRDGYEVAASTLWEPSRSAAPGGETAVQWARADVRSPEQCAELIRASRPDLIFHLAGLSSSAGAWARPAEALQVNVAGTLNLLEAAAGDPPEELRVVVAGSADAYGRGAGRPIGEDAPLRPESAYGATKAAQEVVAVGLGAALGLDVRIARLFPLLGPGQREAFVLPSFCRRALAIARGRGPNALRVGNLDVERDFTDVRDGARALTALAGLDAPGHRVYNVCSGRATPVRRVLEWVLEAAGIDPEIEPDPSLARGGEPPRVVGDPGRMRAETGWRVERDLRRCVAETYQWMSDSLAA